MRIYEGVIPVDEETGEFLGDMDILQHYGMPRRSGRYPWGSGENPYQRTGDFLSRVEALEAEGKSETEIARELEIYNYKGEPSPTALRRQKSIAGNYRRSILVQTAKDLQAKGMGATEIGKQMGLNESTVRSLLNANSESRMMASFNTAKMLKEEIDKNGMIDVGKGVERKLGITQTNLENALMILEMEGYPVYGGRVPQPTNKGQSTSIKVACPPGTEHREIYNYGDIHQINDKVSHDGGDTFDPKWVYPKSLDSNRLMVRYADEGGNDKDGVVELRRGVDDISLGNDHYAQVRILVDGTHYIKGMAVYGDDKDFPPGVDLIFNTNKKSGTPIMSDDPDAKQVLKPIDKKNPDNPFGSLIKNGIEDPDDPTTDGGGQRYYYDKNGEKQLSLINKRAGEGDWGEWKKNLPSQFLSKQNRKLVDQQLKYSKIDKQVEFEELCALTNPTVKKYLLEKFAGDCDTAAVTLKANGLPRQSYQVILPLSTIGDGDIYAPNYDDGEKVALIRYPHGGTFEIPILKVNNKNAEGKRSITPEAMDAVGISKAVADRLSGADFDGDTVMVIPLSGKASITSTMPFDELQKFDAKSEYGPGPDRPEGSYKRMKKGSVQREMGQISNLITDMTILGASDDELIRAVKHSMVVIDAYKHKLDYKASELDNDIASLKKLYQGHIGEDGKYHEGTATIVSRSTSPQRVDKYPGNKSIDPETGKLYWPDWKKPETYTNKKGKTVTRTVESTKMAETDDAMKLVSEAQTPVELLYANYANFMKGMANDARKEMLSSGRIKKDSEAAKKYASEVAHLEAQLNTAELNAPRERQANLLANARIKQRTDMYPELKEKANKKELKKISQQELSRARLEVGAHRSPIDISEKEWEAIQNGAISENELSKILKYADIDKVRQYATPKETKELSVSKISKMKAMRDSGYTNKEIADAVGVSTSTVFKYLS